MPDLSKLSTEELLALRDQAQAAPSLDQVPTEDLLKMREQALSVERPKTAIGESFVRGAAQGASFGWADEITAGAAAVKDQLTGSDKTLGDSYKKHLNESRANYDAARADNPWTYGAGAVGGGIGVSLIPGAMAARAAGALNTFKGAAAVGALTGAGTSENNPFESPEKLEGFAKDTAKGAALGLVAQGGAKAAGFGLKALKPTELEKLANVKTLKAAGFTGPELKKLSPLEKQVMGRRLAESGTVKLFDSLDDIAGKAAVNKQNAGAEIGKALSKVDDLVGEAKAMIDSGKIGPNLPPAGKEALKKAVDKQFQFNMERIGSRINKELIEPNAKNPLLKGELSKLAGIADDFMGGGQVSMSEGNLIKGTQGKVTNFNSETVPQAFKKEVYDIIKTEIDDIVAKTANLEDAVATGARGSIGNGASAASRNQDIAGQFAKAKSDYGTFKTTTDVIQKRIGQLEGNREISLTDTIAGAAGLMSGGPGHAIAIGGLNKLARQYGDSAIASGARTAAKIISKSPELLGKFAGVLEKSAKQGGPALDATHLMLMKNPDYQRILSEYESKREIPQNAMGRRANGAKSPSH